MLFQQENARSHKAATMQRAFVVYNNCPGLLEPEVSRQLNTHGAWLSGNVLFIQRIPQPLPNCDNGCKMLGTIYRRMTFGTFMTVWMREYTLAFPREGDTLCIDVTVWATPYRDVWYIWSEFVIIYSYSDKLPVTSICNTVILSFRVLHFFPAVYNQYLKAKV